MSDDDYAQQEDDSDNNTARLVWAAAAILGTTIPLSAGYLWRHGYCRNWNLTRGSALNDNKVDVGTNQDSEDVEKHLQQQLVQLASSSTALSDHEASSLLSHRGVPTASSSSSFPSDPLPSASTATVTSSEIELQQQQHKKEDPQQINKEKTLEKTAIRARCMFPGIVEKGAIFRDEDQIKEYIWSGVQEKLREMSPEDRGRLGKKENEAELCLALGMNPQVVDTKFKLNKKVESVMGIPIKTPILDSIWNLIMTIDLENPFGTVGDGTIQENYQDKSWLDYLGVKVDPYSLNHAINKIIETLKEKYNKPEDELFFHGTKGSKLQEIVKSKGYLRPSGDDGNQKHDLGLGGYCMRGNLRRAVSWGVGRTWPIPVFPIAPDGADGKQPMKLVLKEGMPAVVAFPESKPFDEQEDVFKVNEELPYETEEELKAVLGDRGYEEFIDAKKKWPQDDDSTWKEFVYLCRPMAVDPKDFKKCKDFNIFHGWLHETNSQTLYNTDYNEGEPIRDPDDWDQWCFKRPRDLGDKKLFIEFHIKWEEWLVDDDMTKEGLAKLQEEVDDGLTNPGSPYKI